MEKKKEKSYRERERQIDGEKKRKPSEQDIYRER